jgi:hypothetical protein
MNPDSSFILQNVPVWFSKACRNFVRSQKKDSRGNAEDVVQRAMEIKGCFGLWDHAGSIKRGRQRHLIVMPYSPPPFAKIQAFATALGVKLVSREGERGFWSPNSFYFEIAPGKSDDA